MNIVLPISIIALLLIAGCATQQAEEPRVCCMALTAECLACADGVSVEEFCAENQGIVGCSDEAANLCEFCCSDEADGRCAAVTCDCSVGNGDAAGTRPADENYVGCEEPRPEICTMDFNPVCGQRDIGIRCITEPCPSTEYRTYGNACGACSDPDVYGYTPGECLTSERSFDDCVAQGNPVMESYPEQCAYPDGERFVNEASPFVDAEGYTLCENGGCRKVPVCPEGYDAFMAQIGPACTKHYGVEDISAWEKCTRSTDDCSCVLASRTTDGAQIKWSAEEAQRCAPDTYRDYMVHGGLTVIDENGEHGTMIA